METTSRDEIALQDITQALINLRVLNPTKILDIYEIHNDENINLKNNKADLFLYWVIGNIPENARTVAKVDKSLLNAENVKKPVIKEYLAQSNVDNNDPNSDNTSNPSLPNLQNNVTSNSADDGEEENWLQYLMKKKAKFDKSDKFKNTILTTAANTVHLNKPGSGLDSNANAELDDDIPEYLREKLLVVNKDEVRLSFEEDYDENMHY